MPALPAVAKEHGAGDGPPPHAQGSPGRGGEQTQPPEHAGPPAAGESEPGPPPHAADEAQPAQPQPTAAAEPEASSGRSDTKKPKRDGHPRAGAASASGAPAAESAPADRGRVASRSAGPVEVSEAPLEDSAHDPRGSGDAQPAPRPGAGKPGAPASAGDPAPAPAAVTFRRALRTTEGAAAAPAAREVTAAASSAAPAAQPTAAAPARSKPIARAKPALPVRAVPRQVRQIVEVVPRELWAALGALALLALALGASSWIAALRARRLGRQREALLQEVGLLQAALLPSVPDGVPVSAAYRPADGASAGGDFYEAFALADGRTAIILGGLADRGRDALARTTFIRYTLRAYLEAGLEPREVVKVGSEALADHLAGGFATLTVATHDPHTGRFTYACAGHAPPLVVGSDDPYEPVTACSAPPVGLGEPTGFRQTSFTLTAGARACLYTQGVSDARVDGWLLGTEGLARVLESLPRGARAEDLLDAVVESADEIPGDMAVCLMEAPADAPAAGPRVEELEVDEREVGDSLEHFVRACGVPLSEVPGILREAGEAARREGSATVRVRLNDFRPGVDVVPGNLVRLEERRRAAGL